MPVQVSTPAEQRTTGRAIWNGMRLRCPHCGRGHLFRSFLKVADTCDVCGEELFHQRADDFPPYISIFITGHILIGVLFELQAFEIAPWIYFATLLPAAVVLPLALLPSIKGAIVGLQWATRMHGFDTARRSVDPALPSYP